MTEDIVKTGTRHVDDMRRVHRQLVEKALHMRCLGYLSQVKARLLTETIFEIDQSKKNLLTINREMARQRELIARQKAELEHSNHELQQIQKGLEQKVAERTADLSASNEALRAEIEERKEAESRLRDSEKHFRGLLETAPDAMIIADQAGEIVLINQQVERLFGFSKEELIGQKVEMLLPQAVRGKHALDRDNYVSHARIRAMGEGHELYGLRKDGTTVPLEISLSPLRTADGLLISTAIRDITERKQISDELRQHREHLEERVAERTAALTIANQELERFSYSVSHDLRAPLRAIDGFSLTLATDYGDVLDGTAKSHLRRVRGAAQRMAQIIDDLLQLSRISRGELDCERIDMGAMARDIAALLREGSPEREVAVEIAPHLYVRGDKGLLRIMLDNLFDNAWKFTAKRRHAKIEFGSSTRDSKKVFYVRDNGVGFDMRHADQLFATFQRLHPQEEYSGTGIGLATVQRIIQRHGGRIWAESGPDNGTSFFFTLPDADFDSGRSGLSGLDLR